MSPLHVGDWGPVVVDLDRDLPDPALIERAVARVHQERIRQDIEAELDFGARPSLTDRNLGNAVKSLALAVSQLDARHGRRVWLAAMDGAA